jgi:leucyl/phenylalanyl-tRNA--protein transferase
MAEELNEISPAIIAVAYRQGLFPMVDAMGEIGWYYSNDRAIFPLDAFRPSRSLRRSLRKMRFEVHFDTAFELVMRSCLRPSENWIDERLIAAYTAVHKEGWAHSVECYLDDRLVGGLYGVAIGGCFCAESMFHAVTDASKIALWYAIERCKELGFELFDAQIMNPHLGRMGAVSVSHKEYLDLLRKALKRTTDWSKDNPYF